MGLPSKRLAKSRSRRRRSAIKITKQTLSVCPKCKKPVKPHHACSFCGTYKNREVVKIKFKRVRSKE